MSKRLRQDRIVVFLFSFALILQFLHYVEHVVQIYQHWWLSLPIKESRGILFFLDLEWNHFIFNAVYLLFLVVVWFLLDGKASRVAIKFLAAGILIQSYHLVEHTVRIWQHIQTTCEPCKGILGWYIDGVYLHFIFNTLVLALPLVAFIRLHRRPRA